MRLTYALDWAAAAVLVVHGLIHLMGFAKAFGYADLPQLTVPMSRASGVAWLLASGLMLAAALTFGAGVRQFWMVGAVALVVSQVVIAGAWHDAWAGTAANVVLLVLVAHGWLTQGPWSFAAEFRREAAAGLAARGPSVAVAEEDLARLPGPVRTYLRAVGVVGQPRVTSYRLRLRGRIRSAPDEAWMPFEAEQESLAGVPTRLFLMRARMRGLPVEAFHRYSGGHARMQVRLAGLVNIVDASGDVMDRSETVTVLNDMALLAPGTLLDPRIEWIPGDAVTATARFTQGAHTISATLSFGPDGLLRDFASDDRSRSSPDGKTFTRLRFTTPIASYRTYGPLRLAAHVEARWQLPGGAFTYGEFELVDAVFSETR